MSENQSFAFVKSGSFSHINNAVEDQLKRVFPDFRKHVVEIRDIMRGSPGALFMAAASALTHDGIVRSIRRADPWDSIIQSPFMFEWLHSRLVDRIRELDCAFTIQTQSMWDSSCPGIPNFVYTDHTHLVNRTYPDFDQSEMYGKWWIDRERKIYQNAAQIFTMSGHVTRSVIEDYGVESSKVRCVFAGSNSKSPQVEHSLRELDFERPVILFVGVEWERKGGRQLVEAFSIVRESIPGARLRIVGCSPDIHVEACEVLGRLPLEEMPIQYAQASVFCLPTRLEPFGIAFVEAMRAGLPIVGSDLGGVRDMVINGVNGWRVAVGDVRATADALMNILLDPSLARRMGAESQAMSLEKYTWDSVGDRFKDAITGHLGCK